MEPPLSLCMIVKDEERNLAKCLDSVRALSPQIVIADTGSADRTVEIARQYGAYVFSFSFERVDFASARNQTLARATGRWILMLDADEVLDPASVPLVQALIGANENAGYYFARRNHASDAEGFTTTMPCGCFRTSRIIAIAGGCTKRSMPPSLPAVAAW